ncbi:hypothetical protein ACQP3L_37840, partial [Escherichia coli]
IHCLGALGFTENPWEDGQNSKGTANHKQHNFDDEISVIIKIGLWVTVKDVVHKKKLSEGWC